MPTKKGRKNKNEKTENVYTNKKRYHGSDSKDNVVNKIKTHFKKFIISLLNYLVYKEKEHNKQKEYFKNFTFKVNNKKDMNEFMEKTILEICKIPISERFRKRSQNQNEKSLKNIHNDEIKKCKLKDLYTQYYLCKSLNEVFPLKTKNKIESLYDYINKFQDMRLKNQIQKFGENLIFENLEYINSKKKTECANFGHDDNIEEEYKTEVDTNISKFGLDIDYVDIYNPVISISNDNLFFFESDCYDDD